jgi:DnaK suppressor protein
MEKRIENIHKYLENEQARLKESLATISGQDIGEKREATMYGKKEEIVTAYSEFEKSSVNIRNVKERINEVEHALEKIMNGTYGVCDECGGLIPPERLEALPQTSLCLPCRIKKSKAASRVGRT